MLIFADGAHAQIRARICAPVHANAEGNEYAVTRRNKEEHAGFSCGSVMSPSVEHFSSYTFVTFTQASLACLVDNLFIDFFFTDLQ